VGGDWEREKLELCNECSHDVRNKQTLAHREGSRGGREHWVYMNADLTTSKQQV
jgi:hypothetical protein